VHVVAVILALIAGLAGGRVAALGMLAIAAMALLLIWAKWKFQPARLPVVILVPWVMVYALARGRWRFRPRGAALA
jgi:hypothetical protein